MFSLMFFVLLPLFSTYHHHHRFRLIPLASFRDGLLRTAVLYFRERFGVLLGHTPPSICGIFLLGGELCRYFSLLFVNTANPWRCRISTSLELSSSPPGFPCTKCRSDTVFYVSCSLVRRAYGLLYTPCFRCSVQGAPSRQVRMPPGIHTRFFLYDVAAASKVQ